MTRKPITGLAIYPDKRVEEVELSGLKDFQAIVDGWIEAVNLRFVTYLSDGRIDSTYEDATMYVNEEFRLGQFGPADFNSIATDVAGLGGRTDLLLYGILGPVVLVGTVDSEGYDLPIGDSARRAVERVAREA